MEKEVYLTILFDYYGKLLTENQQKYFSSYYFDDLSLGEIKENLNISRNGVHKQLKVIEEKLLHYESILHMYEKDKKIEKILEKIDDKKIVEEIKKIMG